MVSSSDKNMQRQQRERQSSKLSPNLAFELCRLAVAGLPTPLNKAFVPLREGSTLVVPGSAVKQREEGAIWLWSINVSRSNAAAVSAERPAENTARLSITKQGRVALLWHSSGR